MPFPASPNRLLIMTALAALTLAPGAAQAGFEWSPGTQAAPLQAVPSTPPPVQGGATLSNMTIAPAAAMPPDDVEAAPLPQNTSSASHGLTVIDSRPVRRAAPAGMPALAKNANPAHMTPMPGLSHADLAEPAAPEPAAAARRIMPSTAPALAMQPVAMQPALKSPALQSSALTPAAGYTPSGDPLAGMGAARMNTARMGAAAVPVARRQAYRAAAVKSAVGSPAAVAGFGRDMPLALTMRQIVPPGYTWNFAPGVDPATKTTWQGGQPWRDTLTNTLAARNLVADIQGQVIRVSKAGNASAPALPIPAGIAAAREAEPSYGHREKPDAGKPDAGKVETAVKSDSFVSPAAVPPPPGYADRPDFTGKLTAGSISAQNDDDAPPAALGQAPARRIPAPVAEPVESSYPRHTPRPKGDGNTVSDAATPVNKTAPAPAALPVMAAADTSPAPAAQAAAIAPASGEAAPDSEMNRYPGAPLAARQAGAVSVHLDEAAGPAPAAASLFGNRMPGASVREAAAPVFIPAAPAVPREAAARQDRIPAPPAMPAKPVEARALPPVPASSASLPSPLSVAVAAPAVQSPPVKMRILPPPGAVANLPPPPAVGAEDPLVKQSYAALERTAPPAEATLVDEHGFNAKPGQSLKTVLAEWCSKAGVKLAWDAPKDYVLTQPVHVSGTFAEAASQAMAQFDGASDHPRGQIAAPDGDLTYKVSGSST